LNRKRGAAGDGRGGLNRETELSAAPTPTVMVVETASVYAPSVNVKV